MYTWAVALTVAPIPVPQGDGGGGGHAALPLPSWTSSLPSYLLDATSTLLLSVRHTKLTPSCDVQQSDALATSLAMRSAGEQQAAGCRRANAQDARSHQH